MNCTADPDSCVTPVLSITPTGLKDDKGGERQLLVDVDDKLVKTENRTVPREDVAEASLAQRADHEHVL